MGTEHKFSEQSSRLLSGDTVLIKKLQLPHGVVAPDVWGKAKQQPAVVSVNLVLSQTFGTVAENDALDENTIHYGQLAKQIRAGCTPDQDVATVFTMIDSTVRKMGMRSNGTSRLIRSEIELDLPKASMSGTSVRAISKLHFENDGQSKSLMRVYCLRNLSLMALIGVNSHERNARQPLIANLELSFDGAQTGSDTYYDASVSTLEPRLSEVHLFSLSQVFMLILCSKIIQATSFETLESLAEHTIEQLQDALRYDAIPYSHFKLRLEKPKAIVFADSAGVEVIRLHPDLKSAGLAQSPATRPSTAAAPTQTLMIIKPYM